MFTLIVTVLAVLVVLGFLFRIADSTTTKCRDDQYPDPISRVPCLTVSSDLPPTPPQPRPLTRGPFR